MTSLRRPVWLAFLLLAVRMALGEEPPVLTQIAEIRNLSRAEANKAFPVRVRGVVTWAASSNWYILQDASAGLPVDVALAIRLGVWIDGGNSPATVGVGNEVEVDGVTHAAGFAPAIVPKTLRVLGKKTLPTARPMVPARFFNGADACERVEVHGVVQAYREAEGGLVTLQMDANPGRFAVEAPSSVVETPKDLVDAEVCLRGVAGTYFNSRGEVIGERLLVSQPGDVVVEKPAARSPFDAPQLALNQLWPFRPKPVGPHRQLVEGTVIYVQSARVCYIQKDDTAVRVETLLPEALAVGDRLQVAGFVDMRRQLAGLSGALIRKVGTGVVPEPVDMAPGDILTLNANALGLGQAAEPTDFDGRLITFRARLLNVQPVLETKLPWQQLTLEAGGTIVEALLYTGNTKAFNKLEPGSELRVTGIVNLEIDLYPELRSNLQHVPSGLRLLLQGPSAVSVLRTPPWWTPQRLIGVVAVCAGLLCGVMCWTWQLHRKLAHKTKLLVAEMHARRNSAIEFQATLRERNRLAANLHDTLLQTVSGLNYQLEACEAESLPQSERKANHLETARQMVQRAQEDLRGTVWALRVLPLHEGTLTEALRTLATRFAEGREVKITITTDGEMPQLSEFVAGNLLLVAQEAMSNALKHSQPSHIETIVSALPDGKRLVLEVRDNGAGFDPEAPSSKNPPHFGLEGMRERVARLGGRLHIESKLGQGTQVRAEVTLCAFDKELADS